MLADLSHHVSSAWAELPEPDKGIVTAAVVLFGLLLIVLLAAVFLVTP